MTKDKLMKKYKILKGFIFEKTDDKKMIIFDQEKSKMLTFNQTASFIFERLKRGYDEKSITKALLKKYKVGEKQARRDVKEIISKLKKRKIIA
jgi:uncharacterized protein YktA (UPF0223 family)